MVCSIINKTYNATQFVPNIYIHLPQNWFSNLSYAQASSGNQQKKIHKKTNKIDNQTNLRKTHKIKNNNFYQQNEMLNAFFLDRLKKMYVEKRKLNFKWFFFVVLCGVYHFRCRALIKQNANLMKFM